MRYTILYIALLFPLSAMGQFSFLKDTVKINEVQIKAQQVNIEIPGLKITNIGKDAISRYINNSIASLLIENSSLFIKSYGMGGAATPSFRGTGASHTKIDWNGITINNPMLGQADLSLIPVGFADEINIYYGTASLFKNTGGIGGVINIQNNPTWEKRTDILLTPSAGSFGNWSGIVKVNTGNENYQTITRGYFLRAENDYKYINNAISADPVWEKRENNQVKQNGFEQEFYLKKSDYIASAIIWYQSAYRNLPASMLTLQNSSNEKQFDESFRSIVNLKKNGVKTSYSISGSYLLSNLNYSNKLVSIDSRNSSETILTKGLFSTQINRIINLNLTITDELNSIKSNNYLKDVSRNTINAAISADLKSESNISGSLLISEMLDGKRFLVPDFSAGIKYAVSDNGDNYLSGSFSRNSKIPGMNDLFWYPGGNLNLRNEYSYVYELAWNGIVGPMSHISVKYNLGLFDYSIKDMIQWHPGIYSYWTPDNIARVSSSGIEAGFSINYSHADLSVNLSGNYALTHTINSDFNNPLNEDAGKQVMYVPENQLKALLKVTFHDYYSLWSVNYTGKRFVSTDNTDFLNPYTINNLNIGKKFLIKGSSADIVLSLDNLFAVNYQSIAYFPLPGRSYNLKIIFQISK